MGGGNGLYCFKLAFVPKNAVATIADDPTAPAQGLGFIEVALPPTALLTRATIPKPDAVVATFKEATIGGGQIPRGTCILRVLDKVGHVGRLQVLWLPNA